MSLETLLFGDSSARALNIRKLAGYHRRTGEGKHACERGRRSEKASRRAHVSLEQRSRGGARGISRSDRPPMITSKSPFVLRPWVPNFASGILVDAHAVYTAYRFQSIPLDLEIEGGVAKRFGSREAGQQWEFDREWEKGGGASGRVSSNFRARRQACDGNY